METRASAAVVPGYAVVEKANEHAQRLRSKKREDVLQSEFNGANGQCGSGRRHKERTALGTLGNANGASTRGLGLAQPSAGDAGPVTRAKNTAGDAAQIFAAQALPASLDLADVLGPTDAVAKAAEEEAAAEAAAARDPHNVTEYASDIFTYLHEIEPKFMAKPRYMRKQRDINHSMRSILVDWLVEVSQEYRLDSQTLFMAVSYIDRFLSEMSVQRGKLQLVGVTAMLLASKYEEIYPPAVDEFVYITDNTYSRDQILKMEHLILKVLKFDMGGVTAFSFYQRYIKLTNADDNVKFLAMYLMELTLQDGERFLKHSPSVLAASALAVARYTVGLPYWPDALSAQNPLPMESVKECVVEIYYSFANATRNPQQAVREKYSHSKYRSVSQIAHPQQPPPV
jgi:cyclin A